MASRPGRAAAAAAVARPPAPHVERRKDTDRMVAAELAMVEVIRCLDDMAPALGGAPVVPPALQQARELVERAQQLVGDHVDNAVPA